VLKDAFGSIENAGNVVGVGRSTVLNWRYGVPHWHIEKIIEAAKENGYTITKKQLRVK